MFQLYPKALQFNSQTYSSQICSLNRAAAQYRQGKVTVQADLFPVGQVRDPS